jgi:hypothetical protein
VNKNSSRSTPAAIELRASERNRPSPIAVAGKSKRDQLSTDAGVLELSRAASESVKPVNDLESMLMDQMAALHNCAMRMIRTASLAPDATQMARLSNSSFRAMEVFQAGALVLHRLRNGGQQVVTVQHVTIATGGQAVIAGSVGARRREGHQNGRSTP